MAFFDWLGDVASGVGDVIGGVGSAIGSGASAVGDFAKNLSPVFGALGSGANLAAKFIGPAAGTAAQGLGVYNALQTQDQAQQQQNYLNTLQQQNLARTDAMLQQSAQRTAAIDAENARRAATDEARAAEINRINQQRTEIDAQRTAEINRINAQRTATDAARQAEINRINQERAAQDEGRMQAIMAANARREGAMAPVQQAGAEQYQLGVQALAGEAPLPPELEARVQAWTQETRQRVRDYMSRAGIGESSMAVQFESWINNQEQQLRGDLARELQAAGLAGFSAGTVQPQAIPGPSDQRTLVAPSDQQTLIAPTNQQTILAPTDQRSLLMPNDLAPQDIGFAGLAAQQSGRSEDMLAAASRALSYLAGLGSGGGGAGAPAPAPAPGGGDPFGLGAVQQDAEAQQREATAEAMRLQRAGERADTVPVEAWAQSAYAPEAGSLEDIVSRLYGLGQSEYAY